MKALKGKAMMLGNLAQLKKVKYEDRRS